MLDIRLTSMASFRMRIVGTRFGTLESIFRKSRGYDFICMLEKDQPWRTMDVRDQENLRLTDVPCIGLTF